MCIWENSHIQDSSYSLFCNLVLFSCTSASPCLQSATHALATSGALHKGSLSLEDLESFFQAVDLSFPSCLPFLVGLRLCNATILQLGIIFIHSGQLTAQRLCV